MCTSKPKSPSYTPPPPPPPEPIKANAKEAKFAVEAEEKKAKLAKGRAGTILTTPLGIEEEATTKKKTLLGK